MENVGAPTEAAVDDAAPMPLDHVWQTDLDRAKNAVDIYIHHFVPQFFTMTAIPMRLIGHLWWDVHNRYDFISKFVD